MHKIHFLVPDTEYPGTLEISTLYLLAVFAQLTLLLPYTRYPDLLLKSNIFLVVFIRRSNLFFVSSILPMTQMFAS